MTDIDFHYHEDGLFAWPQGYIAGWGAAMRSCQQSRLGEERQYQLTLEALRSRMEVLVERLNEALAGHAYQPDHNGECLVCDEDASGHVARTADSQNAQQASADRTTSRVDEVISPAKGTVAVGQNYLREGQPGQSCEARKAFVSGSYELGRLVGQREAINLFRSALGLPLLPIDPTLTDQGSQSTSGRPSPDDSIDTDMAAEPPCGGLPPRRG